MTSRPPPRKQILWIKADPLYPLDSGGKIRTFQMLKEWHRIHDVTYLSLLPNGTPEAAKEHAKLYSSRQVWVAWRDQRKRTAAFYMGVLKNMLFSRSPYVIDKYRSPTAARAIAELVDSNTFDLVVADFLSMTPNIVDAGIDLRRAVVFQHNVESQIWKRHFESATNSLMRAYMYLQWRRYNRFEREMCSRFKGVIAVSEDDASRFVDEFQLRNVLGHVSTGVDVEFFAAHGRQPEAGHLVFLGSMDWMPNIDGITEFVRATYPLIKSRYPAARLTIVGRNPAPAVLALQSHDSGIHVTGTVDDIRPYMQRAAASIVPLRVGGGTRIKIFEAMAMGVPVVSTTIGAEGLPVVDGQHILIADDPVLFAQKVASVLSNETLATSIGDAGKALVTERFSWRTAVNQFDDMCALVLASRQQ